MTSINPENMFWEDMNEKADWFYRTRGRQSDQQLNKKLRDALKQVDVLRKNKFLDLDPGGGTIKQAFQLIDGKRRDRAIAVKNPYPAASDNYASACVEITQATGRKPLFLKLQPLPSAASRLD